MSKCDPHDDTSRNVDQEIFHKGNWMTLILLQLDYDRGLMFVDQAILTPYMRQERKESEAQ